MPLDHPEEKNMSFFGHLEELRWHIIRSVIAMVIVMVVIFVYVSELVQMLILSPLTPEFPTNRLMCKLIPDFCFKSLNIKYQSTSPLEQFSNTILFAVVGGLIVSFPYITWELWRFIKPGLKSQEIKKTKNVVFIVSTLFFTGVAFSYFVILPFTLRFLASFTISDQIENNWRLAGLMALVVQFCLAGGLLFQLPVVTYVLTNLGLLTPGFMRKYRKHFIIVALILAGILTPSPDYMSQILMALPMLGLYEISIWVAAGVEKRKKADYELFINKSN